MSKYTTEVRFICENYAGLVESKGYNDIDSILDEAAPKIFSFDYPIFDEAYRIPLEKKILKHFYTREICEETVGLWKLRLDDKMNIIMPYFNQLYSSELIKFNPLWDTDIHTNHLGSEDGIASNQHLYEQNTEGSKNGLETYNEELNNKEKEAGNGLVVNESNATQSEKNKQSSNNMTNSENENSSSNVTSNNNLNETSNTNYDLFSDTPQGALTGVENENYLTNARKLKNDENSVDISSGKSDIEEKSNSSTQNVGNVNEENERDSTVNSNTTNVDNRSREIDSEKDGNRQNIENTKSKYTNTGSGGNTFNNTNQYIENIAGKRGYGSYSKMLMEFRDTFLNIDEMIINALEPLFFGLW